MPGLTALIPLDTGENSESSLLLLPMLKKLGFERARLLCVFDQQQKQPQRKDANQYPGVRWGPAYMEAYLKDQAARLTSLGYEVDTVVRQGKAVETCIAAAAEPDVDLVLVATHGRTGIARFRLGSVADKIIKDSPCPVMVVGPNVEIDLDHYSLTKITVPLDGSQLAEMALPIAKHLANLSGAEVELVRCVSVTPVAADPMMASVDLLSAVVDEARNYLGRTAATMPGAKATVLTGPAAETILDYLRKNPNDLVVMASRGRTGIGRVAMGSVAERLLQGPDPVLVFEPNEDKGRLFAAARASA